MQASSHPEVAAATDVSAAAPRGRRRRRVTVTRDGYFTIEGRTYSLQKSQHILTEGEWEVWDLDPDMSIPRTGTLSSAGPGPDRPLVSEMTYAAIRDRIDRAAARGGFRR